MFPSWLTTPEMIVTYVLFVGAAVISIYAADIRAAFRIPVRRYREGHREDLEAELRNLKYLHENTYGLLLYLALHASNALGLVGYGFLTVLGIDAFLVIIGRQQSVVPLTQFGGAWCGYLVGRAIINQIISKRT